MGLFKSKRSATPEESVDRWNAEHPVGTRVAVVRDNGDAQDTVTTTAAYVLGGHTAVIQVAGIGGCFMLSRVRPLSGGVSA